MSPFSLSVALSRPHTNSSSLPVTVAYAVPTVAVSQNFSYHNTDGVEVKSALLHCPLRNVKSTAEGENQMIDTIHSCLCPDIYSGLWGVSTCVMD